MKKYHRYRTVCLILLLFCRQWIWAQTSQHGIIIEMNSNSRPLAGAQLKVAGATPTDSDNQGRFTLMFPNSLPGDPLMINTIYKKGFQIINLEKISNWNISPDTELKIVLGRSETINSLRKKYYHIGMSEQEKKYQQTISQIEKLKLQQKLTEEAFIYKCDSLRKEMNIWAKKLELFSTKFACINRDDLDQLEKRAIERLDLGDIQGAIRLYEDMNLDSKLSQKVVMKKESQNDMELILPSLIRHFNLLKQTEDVTACDSVARLLYQATDSMSTKLMLMEWFSKRIEPDEVFNRYSLLLQESKSTAEIDSLSYRVHCYIKSIKQNRTEKKKSKLLLERIRNRREWMDVKEHFK